MMMVPLSSISNFSEAIHFRRIMKHMAARKKCMDVFNTPNFLLLPYLNKFHKPDQRQRSTYYYELNVRWFMNFVLSNRKLCHIVSAHQIFMAVAKKEQ